MRKKPPSRQLAVGHRGARNLRASWAALASHQVVALELKPRVEQIVEAGT